MQPTTATAPGLLLHIRWMIRRDMPEVLRIEQDGFEWPWTEEDFLRCLRERNVIGMSAEHKDEVVGYMVYELHPRRLHIMNLAVHPDYRRQGVGRQMVAKLVGKLRDHRRTAVTVDVRETNLAAQLFFRRLYFRARKVLRGYFEDTGEDAYPMRYALPPQENEGAA